MAKLRTNEKTQHIKKDSVSTTNRQAKRKQKRSKPLVISKDAKLSDLDKIIFHHNIYFKKTKQEGRFNNYLSRELGIPVPKRGIRVKVVSYFTFLFIACKTTN
jgi:hypothetical protein